MKQCFKIQMKLALQFHSRLIRSQAPLANFYLTLKALRFCRFTEATKFFFSNRLPRLARWIKGMFTFKENVQSTILQVNFYLKTQEILRLMKLLILSKVFSE